LAAGALSRTPLGELAELRQIPYFVGRGLLPLTRTPPGSALLASSLSCSCNVDFVPTPLVFQAVKEKDHDK